MRVRGVGTLHIIKNTLGIVIVAFLIQNRYLVKVMLISQVLNETKTIVIH